MYVHAHGKKTNNSSLSSPHLPNPLFLRTGEIFSLYFGSELVVILSGYEITKTALIKNAHTLSDRPKRLLAAAVDEDPDTGNSSNAIKTFVSFMYNAL